ncbi:hypothetical protein BDV96DRAFT_577898 [Lophiotrema nucula]|uniref:DUF1254 domain-containing protein n=1 Tax=Lophiotrema nucula TaxID=690887 RepID=A0A6A5Z238_9PLEO|nr:hypothetical protein BDV96DRAFT_577898 [Lophiotrema nucula]
MMDFLTICAVILAFPVSSVLSQCLTTECAQNALALAYAYGFPLYAYGLYVRRYGNVTTNTLYHQRALTGAQFTGVVRPNADTVYSTTFVDLSENDLELEVPDFGDRYWVWPFSDAYANDVANIGSISNSTPGKYLVRYDQTNVGVQTEKVKGDYKAYLNIPTPYGIAITRILVKSELNDIEAVNDLQDQLNITLVPRYSPPVAPAFNLSLFNNTAFVPSANNSLAQAVLSLTAALAPYNEPEAPQDRTWVPQLLTNAGINLANNTWTQPSDTNLTAAQAAANASYNALSTLPSYTIDLGNNWTSTASSIQGDFGSYYQARYRTAVVGYLALTAEQVIYPSFPNLDIPADGAVLFQFSAKPKIKQGGFWSLTVYNSDQYLVSNTLNRYAIGDRSNLTYSDGTLVYGNGTDDADGPLEVLLQPNDIVPPTNWTGNWLPAPDGGGVVSVTLRWYGPEDSMTNGDYVYPKVTLIDAIRGENATTK